MSEWAIPAGTCQLHWTWWLYERDNLYPLVEGGMSQVPNAFQAVRPRGSVIEPTVAPTARRPGRAPGPLPGTTPRSVVMDSRGRHCVPLAPRTNGAFVIESGAAAQASISKRNALVRGGI